MQRRVPSAVPAYLLPADALIESQTRTSVSLTSHATFPDHGIIRCLLAGASIRVVTFAVWEQSSLLRHGNPEGIRALADLSRKDVTLINREKGAGSRDLLDTGLPAPAFHGNG